jgi:hypothetical protein
VKRDQCLDSAKKILSHDAQQIARFRIELKWMFDLVLQGHTRSCSMLMVFENRPCSCEAVI